jgi:iron complex transport system ATP-binding protein
MRAVGVEHLAARAYPTCSGGERQRVQLARVLAQLLPVTDGARDEKYLLLDEPTAGLDTAHALEALEAARALTTRSVGVMAILHDPNLAARMADRVVVLHRGRVVAAGAPLETLTGELFERAFALQVEILHPEHLDYPVIVPAGSSGAARARQWFEAHIDESHPMEDTRSEHRETRT